MLVDAKICNFAGFARPNRPPVFYNGKTATEKTKEKFIRILEENPYMTAGQIADKLGLTVDGVDYNMRKLKKQG